LLEESFTRVKDALVRALDRRDTLRV